jgi:hypothetical protein
VRQTHHNSLQTQRSIIFIVDLEVRVADIHTEAPQDIAKGRQARVDVGCPRVIRVLHGDLIDGLASFAGWALFAQGERGGSAALALA